MISIPEDTNQFIDAESCAFSYGQKNIITFQIIVLSHLKKICDLSCEEFRGGYTNKQIIQLGGGLTTRNEIYVPDSRARYNQSIDTLYDLIFPFFDKEMKKVDEEMQEEEKKSKDKDELLKVKRKMFRALCSLLNRENFLKDKGIE